jgi:Holliday junction resolvase-like predicted endonuclease
VKTSATILHVAILHETRKAPVCKTGEIVTKSKTCLHVVERFLGKLQETGIITLTGEEIHVTSEQRMRIAEHAISRGADPERVATELRWQEFEGLAAHILDAEGYVTAKHFIFRNSARKYEIDVLGAKEPMVLCVDCKHWHHGWAPSRIVAAARNQMLRALYLSEAYSFYGRKLRIAGWRSAQLLPIVLTLADVSSRLVDGVPIVSALRLRDFLCQVGPWDERLCFVDVPVRSQDLLLF